MPRRARGARDGRIQESIRESRDKRSRLEYNAVREAKMRTPVDRVVEPDQQMEHMIAKLLQDVEQAEISWRGFHVRLGGAWQ